MAKPKYLQVQQKILELISSEKMNGHSLLPTEKEFARKFAVSIHTVRRALENLEAHKLVYRRQGHGTFISGELEQFTPLGTICSLTIRGEERPERIPHNLKLNDAVANQFTVHLQKFGYYFKSLTGYAMPTRDDIAFFSGADGIIISGNINTAWLDLLRSLNLPMLIMGDCHCDHSGIATIQQDWKLLSHKMTLYNINKGAKHLGLVIPDPEYCPSLAIREGFLECIKEHGKGRKYDIFFPPFDVKRHQIDNFLSAHPGIDAIIVEAGLYQFILEYYWSRPHSVHISSLLSYAYWNEVPRNISFGGFDDPLYLMVAKAIVKQVALGTEPLEDILLPPSSKIWE